MSDVPRVRLAELVAALSLGVDLGFGQPMEHVLRQCLIALRLAESIGLSEDERSVVYYSALLVNVGCHSDAHEQAKWFGDDIALKAAKYEHELGSLSGALASLRMIGSGNPPLHRFRVGMEFMVSGHRELDGMIAAHAALARQLAVQLSLPDPVQQAVGASYEQWNGNGWPGTLSGADIPIASRVCQLAEFVEVAHRVGSIEAAMSLAKKRAGAQFDPEVAATFCERAETILTDLDSHTWDTVIAAEPALSVCLDDAQFESALVAIADFVDLKSPYTLGHAKAVAVLVGDAAESAGFDPQATASVRRAGLVHGLGRLGVSNAIWDKPGPLGAGEWERVRMHPYITERMLHQSRALAPLAEIAVQYRERLDGSGYPRGLTGGAISRAARLLGAADAYRSMCEPRPHRDALTPDDAARELRNEVKAGRLDGELVEAVLSAAGHRALRRPEGPAGLTAREIDVLRLLSRGATSKDIAAKLVISPKTVRNHIEHIYVKIGTSSRAAASLFAVQHGLLDTE